MDQAMMMSAGLGTRLKPYTDLTPKPLLPLLAVPLFEWVALQASAAGIKRLVANVHHLSEQFRSVAPSCVPLGTHLMISDESDQLLGSAGGIAKALPHFNNRPFFLLNSDVIAEVNFKKLEERHRALRAAHGVTITLALRRKGPAHAKYREIRVDEQSGLVAELGELQEQKSFYAGVAILETASVSHLAANLPSEFVPEVLRPALAKKQVGFFWLDDTGMWEDIGEAALWWRAHDQVIQNWRAGTLNPVWKRRLEKFLELQPSGVFPKDMTPPNSKRPRQNAFWDGEGAASELENGWMAYGSFSSASFSGDFSAAKKLIAYQEIVRSFE